MTKLLAAIIIGPLLLIKTLWKQRQFEKRGGWERFRR